ncbi:MAG TPA: hypothetical protein VNF74_02465 [Terriglobales bacterium]|nr:hypothetical protein [Terriglobales bacterium]
MRKPLPPPEVHGKTAAERFDNALRKALSVSKADLPKHRPIHRPTTKPAR